MSEKIKLTGESGENSAGLEAKQRQIETAHEAKAKHARHEHQDNITNILEKIESAAPSSHELKQKTKDQQPEDKTKHQSIGKELRKTGLKQSMRQIQKNLKPYQRPFSKFIHNNAIEAVSEFSEKTVARPSGLLFGGIVCFLTSIGIFLICKYYGYEYNYYIGLLSFPIGFGLGLILELLSKPLRR